MRKNDPPPYAEQKYSRWTSPDMPISLLAAMRKSFYESSRTRVYRTYRGPTITPWHNTAVIRNIRNQK
jgi:hypothetical protein